MITSERDKQSSKFPGRMSSFLDHGNKVYVYEPSSVSSLLQWLDENPDKIDIYDGIHIGLNGENCVIRKSRGDSPYPYQVEIDIRKQNSDGKTVTDQNQFEFRQRMETAISTHEFGKLQKRVGMLEEQLRKVAELVAANSQT